MIDRKTIQPADDIRAGRTSWREYMLPEAVKTKIIEKIKEVSSPIRIFLFGSYAYGVPDSASDIDIMVIEKSVASKVAESNRLLMALKDIPFPKDIIVASQDEFDFYKKEAGSIFRTVAEKGVVLYG